MRTREGEDTRLSEATELLEDAAALGDSDGEDDVLLGPGGGDGRGAGAPQLHVVGARLRH